MLSAERASAPGKSPEAGFTLVELLVAMVAGIVLVLALLTMVDVSLHLTSRTYGRVDATQRARTTLEQLMNELHSACVGGDVTPILTGSSATSLIFVSQYGSAASLAPVEHQVTFDPIQHTLTEVQYPTTGGQAPNWIFSSIPSVTRTLLTNVNQSAGNPVFQYFAYQQAPNGSGGYYSDGAGNAYMLLLDGSTSVPGTSTIPAASPLGTPLSQTGAATASEVMVSLVVGAAGGSGENLGLSDSNATVSDAAVLRLTPASNHVGPSTSFSPCQ